MPGRTLLVGAPHAGTECWQERFDGPAFDRVGAVRPGTMDAATEGALIDCGAASIEQARAVRAALADVQLVIVAPAERHALLRREILVSPGLGEVWVVEPGAVDAALIERAASVTRARRTFRGTRDRLAGELARLESREPRRDVISDAYLAALLRAAPDPIISAAESGEVVSWNNAAERLFGVRRSDAIGRPLLALIGATELGGPERDDAGATRRTLAFRRADGEPGSGELIEMPVAWDSQPLRVCIVRDQTRIRRAQRDVEQQAAELEALAAELESINASLLQRTGQLEHALRSRSRFYAAMSHELRTPINAIIGYNALLLDGIFGALTDPQRERLERGQRAARHLLELVNDVLDLSKIEAGRIDLAAETAVFPDLIEDLLDTVRALAEQHDVELRVRGDAAPHRIVTDPRRVRQILLNLLSNAIKFGAGRPVDLVWGAAADGGLAVDVTDRGPGIEAVDIPRIFEEFEQAGDASATGTGLGLPISRRLARLLGGEVVVRSAPGRGSTFRLELPARLRTAAGD
jgi:PAS domain S-box-containing protein